MSVHLVDATTWNLEALSRVHAEAFDPAWSAKALEDLLAPPGTFAIVGGSNVSPDGFIAARVAADEAEILTLVVRRAARRRGLGTSLVVSAALQAEQLGARVIFLEVDVSNLAARSLYEMLGFAVVGRRTSYYGNPAQGASDALTLRASLPFASDGKLRG